MMNESKNLTFLADLLSYNHMLPTLQPTNIRKLLRSNPVLLPSVYIDVFMILFRLSILVWSRPLYLITVL
jgi:hypothetical protein